MTKELITRQVTHCKSWMDIYWDIDTGLMLCKKGHCTTTDDTHCSHESECHDCEIISYTETIDAKAYAQYVTRMMEKGKI